MSESKTSEKGTFHRSEHDKKYDRQMRLWGGHGQKNLELANICVLGAGPAASEILKNLVLPNVGNFTLVDGKNVCDRDCGNNFFVTQDDIGNSRAETVTKWLLEMNPGVKGTGLNKDPMAVIEKELSFFDKFNVVIATEVYGSAHRNLAKYLYSKSIPYVNIRINGMHAYMRVAFDELTIMESHPTNDRTDFYIYKDQLANFKELREYIDSYDIDTKDTFKKPHIPCLAILGQFANRWLAKHDNKLPSNMKERDEFKEGIREMDPNCSYENYDDCMHWAFQCYYEPRVDAAVRAVLKDPKGEKLDKSSTDYWVLIRALRDFMENEGKGFLPVSTNIPDITCDTESFVKLKKIYAARYDRDLNLITGYTSKRLQEIGRKGDSIDPRVIDRFVKNCRSLMVVRTRSVEEEYTSPDCEHIDEKSFDMAALMGGGEENKESEAPYNPLNIHWYYAFRSLDLFYDKFKRLPGNTKETLESDLKALVEMENSLIKDLKLENGLSVDEECLKEMCRYGGSQIHNTAAFIGGVGASLVMKLLLKQFFPYNHTFVYNGIYCSGDAFAV